MAISEHGDCIPPLLHRLVLNMHLLYTKSVPKTGSALSLLVLSVGLAVDVDSALSADHVAVFAKLLHRGSDLESSDGRDGLNSGKKRNSHRPKHRWANARERTVHHGRQGKHGGGGVVGVDDKLFNRAYLQVQRFRLASVLTKWEPEHRFYEELRFCPYVVLLHDSASVRVCPHVTRASLAFERIFFEGHLETDIVGRYGLPVYCRHSDTTSYTTHRRNRLYTIKAPRDTLVVAKLQTFARRISITLCGR